MAALTLTTCCERSLRAMVEAAIDKQLRLLQAGIQRTQRRLRTFEARYSLSSKERVRRYENDELRETLGYAEWVGECRLLERLRENPNTLQGIHIAN